MDDVFSRLIEDNVPRPNRLIMEGLAVHQMKRGEEYLQQSFESANESFPEGLRFVRYERCTPEEEFAIITKMKTSRRVFDLSESSLYLVKVIFEFNGEQIPDRYIYLPYCEKAGIMYLGGTKYHLTPILSSKVLSPERNGIFVRVLRDKITFNRSYHSMIVDDMKTMSYVAWSRIYDKKSKKKGQVAATTKAESTAVHYLLCKYGFDELFRRYFGTVPVYGYDDINVDNYPRSDWVICQSSHVRSKIPPKTFKAERGFNYNPVDIRFAVRRDKWNEHMESYMTGVFYVLDHFPNVFNIRYGDRLDVWLQSPMIWEIAMGHVLWSGHYGENTLLKNMAEHLGSLDHYADTDAIRKLEQRGYKNIENFYDVLNIIIRDFKDILREGGGNNLCVYGKNLETLYYVYYDITEGLFTANYKLNKQALKKPLDEKHISETLKKFLRMGAIYDLRSGKNVTEAVSCSGDDMYSKLTSKVSEQANRPGSSRGGGKRMVLDETKYLDASMIDAGSALFLSNAHPSPMSRISPFANVDPDTGTVLPQPELVDFINELRPRLKVRE